MPGKSQGPLRCCFLLQLDFKIVAPALLPPHTSLLTYAGLAGREGLAAAALRRCREALRGCAV